MYVSQKSYRHVHDTKQVVRNRQSRKRLDCDTLKRKSRKKGNKMDTLEKAI
jgi:hypothetical protein